ncbi:MAG: hypothetical protein OXP66_13945 [Candidatus Tectomicrobia bacterium]|nr:hypothetical protein [Candidatus Tectomicrobia bacterium]
MIIGAARSCRQGPVAVTPGMDKHRPRQSDRAPMRIEAAGSLEQDAVRAALSELEVDTFAGRIRFDETGKNTYRSMGAIQIQDGDILVVAPAAVAVADVIYPAPGWTDR